MLIECRNCGAPLDIKARQRFARCRYCDRQNRVQQTRTIAQHTPGGWQPPRVWTPPSHAPEDSKPLDYHTHSSSLWFVVPLVFVVAIGPLLVAFGSELSQLFQRLFSGAGVSGPIFDDAGHGPGSGGYTPVGEHLQWFPQRAPEPVRLNTDDTEDFVGLYKLLEGSEQPLFLGGFDGRTSERLWKVGPLSDLANSRHVHFAVAGSRVIIADAAARLRVLALSDGRPISVTPLSDRAQELCVNPDNPKQVWLQQVDEKSLLIDPVAGQFTDGLRPPWCNEQPGVGSGCWSFKMGHDNARKAACLPPGKFATAAGFKADYVLSTGQQQVAFGHKHPGTRIPMLAAYASATGAVSWLRNLAQAGSPAEERTPEVSDLVDGRVIVFYELQSGGGRLQALDVTNGHALWDVPVPRSGSGHGSAPSLMRVSPSRVYLPHWTWLDVFDTNSGRGVATVGIW